ncbi:hypothetical protein IW140_002372 [Coemansia sp. RSA 1813]|nr:hypothetical protein EV178_002034 [Coemansia sp. RSA 1646]KAJ1771844.1 hypothetical protein LPJ74_002018 [Coemansia sp. RSA 1843]KAJ2090809.1 hypothetical protein IW138_002427 [Coemansia sp. RSA 986]KAJ2216055.1 hypothetical protein EV179_001706 [Coemansia sp. RSA 487]KAJ2570472.1 hypothetical protein IW140_002372 [Coemansia sp. RSA 1813]
MGIHRSRSGRTYVYKHLSEEQALRLKDIRETANDMDKSYTGYFLLTRSEYCMLLPVLNPMVIAWNTRAYRQMCRSVNVSKETKRIMKQNLLLSSLVGFLPIANIAFNRKFKCTSRNLEILEAQMQDDEFEYEEEQQQQAESAEQNKEYGDNSQPEKRTKHGRVTRRARLNARERLEDTPLPPSAKRMFNKCPRFIRNAEFPHIAYTSASDQSASNRDSVATVYYSPRTSLDLEGFEDLELLSHLLGNGSSLNGSFTSRSSGSDVTLAEQHSTSKNKLSMSFARVMKELIAKKNSKLNEEVDDPSDQKPSASFARVMRELTAKKGSKMPLATATTLKPISV